MINFKKVYIVHDSKEGQLSDCNCNIYTGSPLSKTQGSKIHSQSHTASLQSHTASLQSHPALQSYNHNNNCKFSYINSLINYLRVPTALQTQ